MKHQMKHSYHFDKITWKIQQLLALRSDYLEKLTDSSVETAFWSRIIPKEFLSGIALRGGETTLVLTGSPLVLI